MKCVWHTSSSATSILGLCFECVTHVKKQRLSRLRDLPRRSVRGVRPTDFSSWIYHAERLDSIITAPSGTSSRRLSLPLSSSVKPKAEHLASRRSASAQEPVHTWTGVTFFHPCDPNTPRSSGARYRGPPPVRLRLHREACPHVCPCGGPVGAARRCTEGQTASNRKVRCQALSRHWHCHENATTGMIRPPQGSSSIISSGTSSSPMIITSSLQQHALQVAHVMTVPALVDFTFVSIGIDNPYRARFEPSHGSVTPRSHACRLVVC